MAVVLALGLPALIVIGAAWIILGWILPRTAMARVAATVNTIGKLCFQLIVVGLAGMLAWAVWAGSHSTVEQTHPASISATAPVITGAAGKPAPNAWNPVDPDQEHTKVVFTLAFAKKLRSARTLTDVQRMAGSRGKITERSETDRVGYHWISDPDKALPGFMLVEAFRDGGLGISISPSDVSGVVILNNFGNFDCDQCEPPIHTCGQRPSWMKADEIYCD